MARSAQVALIDLDLTTDAANELIRCHPEYDAVVRRLVEQLDGMHVVLTEIVRLMTAEGEDE